MFRVKVKLGDRSYEIIVGTNIIKEINSYIRKINFSAIVIITDTNVEALYGGLLRRVLPSHKILTIRIPPGEKHKTLYTASAIYDQMAKAQVHRDALVVAFGGGVVNDLAGFVAATYMRGLPFIQVPTTLLAQVDASIGGKTGIDHPQGKNLIGAFYQPELVFVDTVFLNTLPPKEFKNGLAEVLKYGIIKDPQVFKLLESNPKADAKFWEEIIARCAKIKSHIVSNDERETTGLRMILNLGHTFGHAIESATGYSKYTHGEAVALGISAAAHLANKLSLLKNADLERIINLISQLKLPVKTDIKASQAIKMLALDKKVKAGNIRFVLPAKIGKVVVKDNVPMKFIRKALSNIGCK